MTQTAHTLAPQVSNLSPVDQALLTVMRYFLDAFLRPDTLGWRHAMAAATGIWGEARGLAIANAVQSFLDAMLRHRPVPLRYNDPLDLDARDYLTDDEALLLGLLRDMRNDRVVPARTTIAQLTGGRVYAQIVQTGLELAVRLDPSPDGDSTAQRPVLRLVR